MWYKTTINNGHMHYYKKKNKYTTINSGHKHPIKGYTALKGNTSHIHKLTNEKK